MPEYIENRFMWKLGYLQVFSNKSSTRDPSLALDDLITKLTERIGTGVCMRVLRLNIQLLLSPAFIVKIDFVDLQLENAEL